MDVNKSIRTAVDTGDTKIGLRETKKAYMAGTLKLVVVAKNCPKDHTEEIELWDVPIMRFHPAAPSMAAEVVRNGALMEKKQKPYRSVQSFRRKVATYTRKTNQGEDAALARTLPDHPDQQVVPPRLEPHVGVDL